MTTLKERSTLSVNEKQMRNTVLSSLAGERRKVLQLLNSLPNKVNEGTEEQLIDAIANLDAVAVVLEMQLAKLDGTSTAAFEAIKYYDWLCTVAVRNLLKMKQGKTMLQEPAQSAGKRKVTPKATARKGLNKQLKANLLRLRMNK